MKLILNLILFSCSFFSFSQTDIFQIARKGNVEELKSYLKANPNTLNSVNENGSTPLILACYYNILML